MPIRRNFAVTLTFAGAIACGVAFQAHAESPGLLHLAQAKERDLQAVPSYKGEARPKVTLIPNASVVSIGGWVNFRVSSSVSGYGHLYVMSASGRAQVWMENVPIAAGQRLVFPVGSLGIKASAPAGREDLMLIVTKQRIDGFFGYDTTRTPRVVEYDHQTLQAGADSEVRRHAAPAVGLRAHLGAGRAPLLARRSHLGLGPRLSPTTGPASGRRTRAKRARRDGLERAPLPSGTAA